MKKTALVLATAAVAATATVSFAGMPAATGVNGSFHDMNVVAGLTQDSWLRVCVFCHTPHNAQDPGTGDALPLWNHEASAGVVWQPYIWATPANDGAIDPGAVGMSITGDSLVGPSRMCMSCHDGATAPDQHNQGSALQPAAPGSGPLAGFRAIGLRSGAGAPGDLTDDHPIGFNYINAAAHRNAGAKPEIVDATESFATAVSTVAFDTVGGEDYNAVTRDGQRRIEEVLYQGQIMTCASCHEVHNYRNVVSTAADVANGATPPNMFLYAKERDSLICLSCHYK